jgi:hypothetical protein
LAISNTTAQQVILFVSPTAAVFVEAANNRMLREFELAADATAYYAICYI